MTLLLMLAAIGAAFAVTESSLFGSVREWAIRRSENGKMFALIADLMTCPRCASFWSGMIVETIRYGLTRSSSLEPLPPIVSIIMFGLAAHAVAIALSELRD